MGGMRFNHYATLLHVWVEPDKMVLYIELSPNFGPCMVGNSENGAVNIFPAHYNKCSLMFIHYPKYKNRIQNVSPALIFQEDYIQWDIWVSLQGAYIWWAYI